MQSETRHLAIDMTGNGPGSASLRLVTESGLETPVRLPNGFPNDRSTRIVFDAPSNPFRLIVQQDADDRRWVAFRGPIEIGRLRRFADRMIRQAWTLLAFGLAALLVSIIFARPADEALSSRRAAPGMPEPGT